jgi:hypothetical protein
MTSPISREEAVNQLSQYDKRYIERNYQAFDPEFTVYEDMGAEFRGEIEARRGHITHRSRSKVKSESYDWRLIDHLMTLHHWSNSNMAFWLECSSGTIANIRSGNYTGRPMIERVQRLLGII